MKSFFGGYVFSEISAVDITFVTKYWFCKFPPIFEIFWYYERNTHSWSMLKKKKKRRSAPGPLGDFCIVSFKNSVSFYFVKKIRKLPSILYDNCL